jgi:hypothetical protein
VDGFEQGAHSVPHDLHADATRTKAERMNDDALLLSVAMPRKKRGAGKFSRASFPYALKLFRGVIVFCRG